MSRFSSPNIASAKAFASSVLPTPVGPRNMKEPMGRLGSFSPARALFIAFATAVTASSCPITRLWSISSRCCSFSLSPSVILRTGMPVHSETISAISSSPILSFTSWLLLFHSACSFSFCSTRLSRSCLSLSARSYCSCLAASDLFSSTSFILSSSLRISGGVVKLCIFFLLAASSIRSMALSGRNLSVM